MKLKIIISFLFSQIIVAQNLVKNPSFEEYKNCPSSHDEFNINVTNWSSPTNGTSDYYNRCSAKFGDTNPHGYQKPKDKKGYAGIVTYYENRYNTLKNYREYLQGELKTPLVKGQRYKLKIHISLADKANVAIEELSLLFLEYPMQSESETYIDLVKLKKDNLNHTKITFKYKPLFTNKDKWMALEKEFIAKGFENRICFGNFNPDNKTKKRHLSKPYLPLESYYYIDDISITAIKPVFQTKKTYTFKNVLFNFNKAVLLKNSLKELEELSRYLKVHAYTKVKIYGHTDNIGTELRNKELSQQRAKAVSDYLIENGLDNTRIKWEGFGAKHPLIINNTEINRAKNRRVEFKLFEK